MRTSDSIFWEPQPREKLIAEIAIQAELLALNCALEGQGAEQTCEALHALAKDIRCAMQATQPVRSPLHAEP